MPPSFVLDPSEFDGLFPFHLFLDASLSVRSHGQSLAKVCSIAVGTRFSDTFFVKRPSGHGSSYTELRNLVGQLVILGVHADPALILRGEFKQLAGHPDSLFFIGAPWFPSIDDAVARSLSLNDFAIHDSIIDFLGVMKAKDVAADDTQRLLERLNRQTKTLLESDKRTSALLANLQSGVLLENESGGVIVANETLFRLFEIAPSPSAARGASAPQLLRELLPALLAPEDFLAKVESLIREKTACLQIPLKLLNDRHLAYDYIPIFVSQTYKGHLLRFADVTEARRHEGAILAAKQKAEESVRAKEEFLANMSHEIRTPMNGIIGFADLLQETPLDELQSHYIRTLKGSAESLLAIINDILDLSKVEAGLCSLDPTPMDLEENVREVATLLFPRVREKGLSLDIRFAEGTPRHLLADRGRLRQILLNLVGNAVKFTERGWVSIEVRVEKGPSEDFVKFAVSDTGIGIAASDRPRLFQKFAQADSTTTRRFGGTGLGLAICKQFVELMGGQIGVESAPDQGSTFWFTLPLREALPALPPAPPPEPPPQPASPEAHAPAARKLRVLVAEDNRINQMFVMALLQKLGCSAELVSDGAECVERYQKEPFDLILMDCHMPKMDGFEATRTIRQLAAPGSATGVTGHSPIRIAAVTASAMREDHERCIAAGMDLVLTKPLRAPELQKAIGQLIP
ncbi:MAG: hypothetical protein RLZZ244_2916 [Verrucomicrobiota bacterium]